MKEKATRKRAGVGLETRMFNGRNSSYMVFRTKRGGYHVFIEVEAKQAAVDCGAPKGGNTQAMWDGVWSGKYRLRNVKGERGLHEAPDTKE
jgi:hypothetical protein